MWYIGAYPGVGTCPVANTTLISSNYRMSALFCTTLIAIYHVVQFMLVVGCILISFHLNMDTTRLLSMKYHLLIL